MGAFILGFAVGAASVPFIVFIFIALCSPTVGFRR